MRRALVVGTGPLIPELVRRLESAGRTVDAITPAAMDTATGIHGADVVLAVDDDDAANLATALRARHFDPGVRLVVRQFDRTIGGKLESALPNCRVVSVASLAAATYAAIALDPRTLAGVEFPDGRLVGVAVRQGGEFGAPARRTELERRSGLSILCVGGVELSDRDDPDVAPADELIVSGPIDVIKARRRGHRAVFVPRIIAGVRALLDEIDPIFGILAAVVLILTAAATAVFARGLHLDILSALYFSVTTITTTGYGDVSLLHASPAMKIAGMVLMVAGVGIINLTLALLATAFVRAQWTVVQGTREVRANGHVVVCGAGRVGTRVMQFLQPYEMHVVIVDVAPSPGLVRLSRRGRIDVITGDATASAVLDAAAVEHASALVVTTDRDAANVEVALAARTRRADLPVIMRIGHPLFARAAQEQLGLRRTRSPLDVAVPVIAGLADDPALRGEVVAGGYRWLFRERGQNDTARGTIVARAGERVLEAVAERG